MGGACTMQLNIFIAGRSDLQVFVVVDKDLWVATFTHYLVVRLHDCSN